MGMKEAWQGTSEVGGREGGVEVEGGGRGGEEESGGGASEWRCGASDYVIGIRLM
jgi:hypothetical protein